MEYSSIFTQISLVIVLVAVVSLVMRLLKQPLIMGYIITGIVVGPSVLNLIHSKDAFESFSEIGITLLLFIIGLGLNAGVIKSLGRVALITATSILVLVGATGFGTSEILGFNQQEAVLIGLALFFSSTIIILKVLSDKREISRLYAQIAIGVILLDDIVATLALLVVAAAGTAGGMQPSQIFILVLKGVVLALGLYVTGAKIMPRLTRFFAHSQELLFIFAVAWGFGIASLFAMAGFSHEVGALFAGVSLASVPYAAEMSSRLKPLRDFFIVLFFVTLGETFTFGNLSQSIVPALILSAVVIIGKPLFVLSSLGALGYTKLTSFKAGIHLSQISEFSIILIVFANKMGLVSNRVTSIITLVALITIGVSTYLMKYDEKLYRLLEKPLRVFERKNIKERKQRHALYPIILFGYHHGGHEFLSAFREMKQRYLVVDYDPEVIEHLEEQGVRHAYGDATDNEFLDEINTAKAQLVVSTVTDAAVNRAILTFLRHHNPDAVFICHATNYEDATELYHHGATYVILPHFLGSERISSYIKAHGFNKQAFEAFRQRHINELARTALDE